METIENVYAQAGVGHITTFTGKKFNLERPDFDLEDIAHALANTCRYGGHCRKFYSVAEHSVNVARIMDVEGLGDPREGIMHDATEAYLSDVPAPFKQFLPDWAAIDHRLEALMRDRYQIGRKTAGCKEADWLALFIEAYALLPDGGESFHDPLSLRPYALQLANEVPELRPRYLMPAAAKSKFLAIAEQLEIV